MDLKLKLKCLGKVWVSPVAILIFSRQQQYERGALLVICIISNFFLKNIFQIRTEIMFLKLGFFLLKTLPLSRSDSAHTWW